MSPLTRGNFRSQIGINYRGQKHELRGCVNDSKHCFNFLVRRAGYHPHNIVLLTDDSLHGHSQPTRRNILDAMKGLVRDARPHDVLFFSNSGHGGQMPHLEGDEVDGYDEVIFPLEFKRAGHITDDEMHAIMVRPLPTGCRLTAVFANFGSPVTLGLRWICRTSITTVAGSKADISAPRLGRTSADTFPDGVAVGAASHLRPSSRPASSSIVVASTPRLSVHDDASLLSIVIQPRVHPIPASLPRHTFFKLGMNATLAEWRLPCYLPVSLGVRGSESGVGLTFPPLPPTR
ncbi:caspase domain-containing protein [Roridomyces roridus]|uniref:Caspase domain-containing protein n=1 Tax=Roridomyces roridus TaxID=1738132 RepID=A0AAD7C1F9_9AGAR|nr:caspase domain-containing protein [Roridomyces roridus]